MRGNCVWRRAAALVLVVTVLCAGLAACGRGDEPAETTSGPEDQPSETVTVRLAGLKGPTTMGLVKLLADAEDGKTANAYDFLLAGSADEITPKLISGSLDMAAVPANLASVLYNRTEGEVMVLAVNTLGVLYIVEKGDSVASMADLRGKTVYATGKGSTPEYALRFVLEQNGLNPDTDVTIEWKSEPTEVVALLNKAEEGVAMLPQPYVTVVSGAVSGLRVVLDLTEEWERLETDSSLITGTMVVRRSFAEAHPEAVSAFLAEYGASIAFVNGQVEEAAALVERYGIVKADVARKAIPACHLTFLTGADMKAALGGYLTVLFGQAPKAVGGALPGDNFYYGAD